MFLYRNSYRLDLADVNKCYDRTESSFDILTQAAIQIRLQLCYEHASALEMRPVRFLVRCLRIIYSEFTVRLWPAVARAGEASTYSRRIAYIPENSHHINNFLQ